MESEEIGDLRDDIVEIHESGRHGRVLLSWDFWEFRKYRRGPFWYAAMVVGGLGLLIYALLSGNFLFALIIVMFGLVMYLVTVSQPGRMRASVTETGIIIGKEFYSYRDIKHFWIVYEPPQVQSLYLDIGGVVRPRVVVDLEEANPNAVRKSVGRFVPEDLSQDGEPIADIIGRLLKIS